MVYIPRATKNTMFQRVFMQKKHDCNILKTKFTPGLLVYLVLQGIGVPSPRIVNSFRQTFAFAHIYISKEVNNLNLRGSITEVIN